MSESKILEDDRDEWFYNSLKRYTNLYMFDLEFPVDGAAVIDDTSICVSGLQNFSKKCEIVQLSIPPKLLPKHIEDGLCKDRDFKILSGGYSTNRVTQIKPLKAFPNFITTIEHNTGGCKIFRLGDDEHGIIKEEACLTCPELSKPSTIATFDNQVILNSCAENVENSAENTIYQWRLNPDFSSSSPTKYSLESQIEIGRISKLNYWEENVACFCTTRGFVSQFDFRQKNLNNLFCPSNFTDFNSANSSSVVYSFDCIPSLHKVGIVDSNGRLFVIDTRNVKDGNAQQSILESVEKSSAVLGEKFNLEYDPKSTLEETKFVVTGMKQDVVPVFKESQGQPKLVFTHDGHTKTVTNVSWHSLTANLLFSTSVDSVLHAWQYISEEKLPET